MGSDVILSEAKDLRGLLSLGYSFHGAMPSFLRTLSIVR